MEWETHLQERRRLRGAHPPNHRLEELWEHRQDTLARTAQEMDDEVSNDKPSRLVLAPQLLRDDLQYTVQARLPGRRVSPGYELVDVFADDERQASDTVL